MKIYKNPWVLREQYFIPTGAAKSAKCEGKKTAGYKVDFWDGKWIVGRAFFYNSSLNQMPLICKTKESIASIINAAIIKAVLEETERREDNDT